MTNRFDKVVTMQEALSHFRDGMTLLAGGFGGVGNPPTLIQGILDLGVRDLTLISNDTAFPHIGIGKLVTEKRVKKVIASHIGSNPNAGAQMTAGELEVEFCPQGILAERVRAGGVGLGGILSDVGIGTIAEKGKQKVVLDGKEFLLETPLTAEVAIVHAKKSGSLRQSGLRYERAQLQSACGDGRRHHHCRSGRDRRGWRAEPGRNRDAGRVRQLHRAK